MSRIEVNYQSRQMRGLAYWYPFAALNGSRLLSPLGGPGLDLLGGAVQGVGGPYGRFMLTAGTSYERAHEATGRAIGGFGLTIAVWLRYRGYGGWAPIIAKTNNTDNSGLWDWGILTKGSAPAGLFLVKDGANNAAHVPLPLTDDKKFHHLVMSVHYTQGFDTYYDGERIAQAAGFGNASSNVNNTNRQIYVGGYQTPTAWVNQDVAEIRVYNRKLSDGEVMDLYRP